MTICLIIWNLLFVFLLFSVEPSSIPNLSAIQRFKSNLTLEKRQTEWQKLEEMVQQKEFLRFLGRGKIFAWAFTDSQINFYKNFVKNNHTKISIDSTGTFIKNPEKGTINQDIEMFTMHLERGAVECSVPVGSLFTTMKKYYDIEYFFKKWLDNFKYPPNEIVIDQSNCLLLACVTAFCGVNVEDYVRQAFSVISGKLIELQLEVHIN